MSSALPSPDRNFIQINTELMSAENKEIVRKVNSAFQENNMDAVLGQCNDNIKWVMVGEVFGIAIIK